jgi:hypothetical protein
MSEVQLSLYNKSNLERVNKEDERYGASQEFS